MSSEIQKKKWKLKDKKAGQVVEFFPVWDIKNPEPGLETPTITDKDVECKFIEMNVKGADGKEIELSFNFLDIFMFIYYVANEELRQQLMSRYERKITEIPYGVTFTLSQEEKEAGVAKRRIVLEVDEIAMAMARARENEMAAGKFTNPVEWMAKWKARGKKQK